MVTTKLNLNGKKIHILGIAGMLMGAFATFLKRQGIAVTGSDQNFFPPMSDVLKKEGIDVFTPYSALNIEKAKPDLIIVGNVIRKTNPEMEAVLKAGIAYESLPSFLEKNILPTKHSIVIAGTHGKTTTSSMMAWILEQLGENPSFFVGGVLQNFTESFRITDSKYMTLEGDEYDTAFFDKVPKFTHYMPKDVILTSVEYDHADIYPNISTVIAAFDKLASLVPSDGFFITCAEQETPMRVAYHANAHVLSYGFSEGVDSRASSLDMTPEATHFRWEMEGQEHKVFLNAIGRHNILNALACLTLAKARKWDVEKVIHALATFKGVKRRQEIYGIGSGITLIDDFAHHPTAVRETLAALKIRYPSGRMIACFEPRSSTSRRKVFQKAYVESFENADLIYIAKPFDPSSIDPKDLFSSEELIHDLKTEGKQAKLLSTSAIGMKELAGDLKSGDVVVVMSNGSFDGLLPKLLERIRQ